MNEYSGKWMGILSVVVSSSRDECPSKGRRVANRSRNSRPMGRAPISGDILEDVWRRRLYGNICLRCVYASRDNARAEITRLCSGGCVNARSDADRSARDYDTAVRVTECLKFSERGQVERSREDDARSNNRRRSHRLCTQPLESVLTNSRRRRRGRGTEGKKCWRAFFFLWVARSANRRELLVERIDRRQVNETYVSVHSSIKGILIFKNHPNVRMAA